MHNRRISLAAALGFLAAGASHAADLGRNVLDHLMSSAPSPGFGQRYGGNPRSTGNGGNGRGAVARSKRAARKRNNVRKRQRAS